MKYLWKTWKKYVRIFAANTFWESDSGSIILKHQRKTNNPNFGAIFFWNLKFSVESYPILAVIQAFSLNKTENKSLH